MRGVVRVSARQVSSIARAICATKSDANAASLQGALAMIPNMDLEAAGTRGFFRPVARVTLEQGFEMIGAALAQARTLGLADVIVNTLGFSGFETPRVFDRY